MKRLRDGSTSRDPRLGRIPEFDELSRQFPVRTLLEAPLPIRSKTWRCDHRLDQGATPSCVGHAWAQEWGSEPQRHGVTSALAMRWYKTAQDNDEWAGSNYPGSSTLGGAKAGVVLGKHMEYRWAFSLNELLLTVGYLGPVVVGTSWLRRMFSPDHRGKVEVAGPDDGGHEWMIRGVDIAREEIIGRNSWGPSFGVNGDFRVSFSGMGLLLERDGDCCFPVRN